jgi:hypothetical protein
MPEIVIYCVLRRYLKFRFIEYVFAYETWTWYIFLDENKKENFYAVRVNT